MSRFEPEYTTLFEEEAVEDMADELGPILDTIGEMNNSITLGSDANPQAQTSALYRAIGDVSSAHGVPTSERVHFALAGVERHYLRQLPEGLSDFRDVIEPMMMAFYDGGESDE